MKQPRHVFVRWLDTQSQEGWTTMEQARREGKPAGIWSSGFVVSDTKKQMILAQNHADDGAVNGREIIPRGCIQQVVESVLPFQVEGENNE